MGVEQRIHLWHELRDHSRELDGVCSEAQNQFDAGHEAFSRHIEALVQKFRMVLADLQLLRSESDLLRALIGHDFVDRFSGLHLRLELLKRKSTRENLDKACRTIWLVREIIESLVFWINHQSITLEKVSLDQYLEKIVHHLRDVFRDIELRTRIEGGGLEALFFTPILSNFLMNMIVNAQKHGSATKVELVLTDINGHPTLVVRDDGFGLDVPFPEISKGLGLLMIEKRLEVMKAFLQVEEHGGIDGGALFRIVFSIPPNPATSEVVQLPGLDE
ncbi:MAG: hypothetical protein AB7J40_01485 [Candidatus Altimarinota bacterium]